MSRAPQVALFLVFLLAGLVAAGAYGFFIDAFKGTGPLTEPRAVYIAPGTPTNMIGLQLRDEGVLAHPTAFLIGARVMQWEHGRPLKAGEYMIPARASASDIVRLLQSGKTYQRRVTIPEGLMAVEIVAILNAAEGLTGTIDAVPAEGSLLPETYNYSYGEPRQQVLSRMQAAMTQALATLWAARSENLPVKTPEETVALASIVEKETGIRAERPRVAGVFVNRLNINMPLQSDPTVIYAVTQGKFRLDRPLSRKDLAMTSPYNTYTTRGLTPGPIANPGRESLHAVLHPESHGFFYFVADGTGGHAFSTTLKEHEGHVVKLRALERAARDAAKTAPPAPTSIPAPAPAAAAEK